MTYAPQSAYQEQAAMTATPAGLVLMLFDGALAAVAKSTEALQQEKPGENAVQTTTRCRPDRDHGERPRESHDQDAGGTPPTPAHVAPLPAPAGSLM